MPARGRGTRAGCWRHDGDESGSSRCAQRGHLRADCVARCDQIRHDPIVDIQRALVFAKVPHVMALRKNSPHVRPQAKSVRQQLEDDVALTRSTPVPAKRGKTQRMCRVVCKIESAFERELRTSRIAQANVARFDEALEFRRIARLRLQRLAGTAQLFKRRDHPPLRSARSSAVPARASRTRCRSSCDGSDPSWRISSD